MINLDDKIQRASIRRTSASRRGGATRRFGDLRSWQDVLLPLVALLVLSFWALATR